MKLLKGPGRFIAILGWATPPSRVPREMTPRKKMTAHKIGNFFSKNLKLTLSHQKTKKISGLTLISAEKISFSDGLTNRQTK